MNKEIKERNYILFKGVIIYHFMYEKNGIKSF